MSIQSNINNTIGQAAMLATLNPKLQELGETAKDKSKLKSVEKQLDTLTADKKELFISELDKIGPAFGDDREAERYNKLREAHNELSGKLAGKGVPINKYYKEGINMKAVLNNRLDEA